jgi:hypothetical protein
MTHNPEYEKEYRSRPEVKQYQREYHQRYKNTQKYKDYQKEYRKTEKGKALVKKCKSSPKYKEYLHERSKRPEERKRQREYMKKKRQTPEGKRYQKEYNEKYDWSKYYHDNKEKVTGIINRYNKTEKGKIRAIKARDKRRQLGFEKLYENIIDEPVDWHHIDDKKVVAIPKDLHEMFLSGKDSVLHREMLKPIIEQLYGFS